jgi:hypothetical protein
VLSEVSGSNWSLLIHERLPETVDLFKNIDFLSVLAWRQLHLFVLKGFDKALEELVLVPYFKRRVLSGAKLLHEVIHTQSTCHLSGHLSFTRHLQLNQRLRIDVLVVHIGFRITILC